MTGEPEVLLLNDGTKLEETAIPPVPVEMGAPVLKVNLVKDAVP